MKRYNYNYIGIKYRGLFSLQFIPLSFLVIFVNIKFNFVIDKKKKKVICTIR